MSVNIFGLDIGTSAFKMSSGDRILNEHNCIALSGRDIVNFGDDAYDMFEKAPANIKIIFPVKTGVIADIEEMHTLLKCFHQKISGSRRRGGVTDFYIAVPNDVTEVEKRAFYELVVRSKIKCRHILVVDKPVADAAGAGVDVGRAKGVMVVNMGAGVTEVSVLSFGGIVTSKSVHTGGDRMDENIIHAVRNEYNLEIGKKTAERLKQQLAFAGKGEEKTFPGFGRNVLTGLPVSASISSRVICKAISEPLSMIMDKVRFILENTLAELSADIIKNGIFLTGGVSQIPGLKDYFFTETEVQTNLVDNPTESTVRGLDLIATKAEFNRLAYVPEDRYAD